ncbi:MAG: hypothetical protein OXG08_00335 [Gammaproteobacteria bacterium]|nr:hypothetical protein [Gammaproteobacteria bacterium]
MARISDLKTVDNSEAEPVNLQESVERFNQYFEAYSHGYVQVARSIVQIAKNFDEPFRRLQLHDQTIASTWRKPFGELVTRLNDANRGWTTRLLEYQRRLQPLVRNMSSDRVILPLLLNDFDIDEFPIMSMDDLSSYLHGHDIDCCEIGGQITFLGRRICLPTDWLIDSDKLLTYRQVKEVLDEFDLPVTTSYFAWYEPDQW